MIKRKRPRRYDASGRRSRAAEGRERALDAARELFANSGYAETTMDAIARAAGMALPTLYAAFQSKRGLLAALLNRQVSGEPGSPSVLKTPGAQAVLGETDPRRALARFARDIVVVQDRAGPTYDIMKNAARTEPDLIPLLERAQEGRYRNLAAVAERLGALGALRPGLGVEDAARTIWALASWEVRHLLARHGGWSPERYAAWLEQTLAAALLAPQA